MGMSIIENLKSTFRKKSNFPKKIRTIDVLSGRPQESFPDKIDRVIIETKELNRKLKIESIVENKKFNKVPISDHPDYMSIMGYVMKKSSKWKD